MIAATVADVDGLGLLLGREMYERWHHVACHGLPFALLACAILAALLSSGVARRIAVGILLLICFHLHLLMDYWGSGPGWPIVYLYPFSEFKIINWDGWDLSSWQNSLTAGVLLAITIVIGAVAKRTPLEVLMPSLDAKLTGRAVISSNGPKD